MKYVVTLNGKNYEDFWNTSINDINKELINCYRCIKADVEEVIKQLYILEEEYLSSKNKTDYFYKVRNRYNEIKLNGHEDYEKCADFIFLNKTCFNGLYRVNSKGFFNVPSGKKRVVNCFDKKTFNNLNLFFKNRKPVITSIDFEEAVKNAKAGDFVYFDPPYDTWEEKNSFTSYDKNAFGKEEQVRLAKVFKELSNKGVYVMLSNHNTKFINELYKGFHISVVPAKRMINSKADGRGEVEEVIITNYE
mgnify:CR=1 FL=1